MTLTNTRQSKCGWLGLILLSGLAGEALLAQDYQMTESSSRGIAVISGTSLGAFTATPTYFDFQNGTAFGNFSNTFALPSLVANPVYSQMGQSVQLTYTSNVGFAQAPQTIKIWTTGTVPAEAIALTFDLGSVTYTNDGTNSRFTGAFLSATGTVTISGQNSNVGSGTGAYSLVYRAGDYILSERTGGAVSAPATGTSSVVLNAGATLSVAAGSGTFRLSPSAGNYGVLQIGNGGASGSVLASEITGGVGGGQVVFDQSDELTFSPLLTGNLSVRKTGTGSVTLANANTYTAGTFLDGGTLITQNPQALGTGPITATNTSALMVYDNLTVSSGSIAVLNGVLTVSAGNAASTLTTPGDLSKTGAGVLSVLNRVLVNGNANVMDGTLSVDGLLQANNVILAQQAFLKGHGVVQGNVVNGGNVAPGNSPGTLTINGNYTQLSSGTLDIEMASATVYDQLIVHGNASLAGTLQLISYNGFKLQPGQQLTFLVADTVSGSFNSVVAPAGFRGRILQTGGEIAVLVAPQSYAQIAGLTQNQKNVAGALNSFIPATKGDKQTVSLALDELTTAEYPSAFNQIAPTFYESLGNTTIELANAQNQVLSQRLSAVRLGTKGFSSAGMQAVLVNDKDGKSVRDAKGEKDILQITPETKWGVWVQGNGIFARVTNVSDVPNYRYASGGFTAGADYAWSEHFSTGLYGGYQGTYAKYSGEGGSTEINQALFGGYATAQFGGFYADGIVGGGYSSYNVRRPIQFGSIDRTATSKPDGAQLTTYLDAGYNWNLGHFTFGPLVAGQYTYAGIAGFTEAGADSLDLHVDQQDVNSLRTNIGGRLAYTWNLTPDITIIPEGRMFWQHEFLNNSRTIGASLNGGGGPGFDYQTANPGRDSVLATAGVSAQFGARWNANAYYTADFGNQSFISHMISAGLEWKF